MAINAKRDINQRGSDVDAANDIELTAGRNINIDAARESVLTEQIREKESNGLGVSINQTMPIPRTLSAAQAKARTMSARAQARSKQ